MDSPTAVWGVATLLPPPLASCDVLDLPQLRLALPTPLLALLDFLWFIDMVRLHCDGCSLISERINIDSWRLLNNPGKDKTMNLGTHLQYGTNMVARHQHA